MKLMSVTINGFRRLKNETTMNLDGKLTAIVGANEAGKSSFLEALQHLDNNTLFIKTGASREISRDLELKDNDYVIEARYLIEDSDRLEITQIEDTSKVRWFKYFKAVNGKTFFNVEPRPKRNLKHRTTVQKALQKALIEITKFEKNIVDDEDELDLSSRVKSQIEVLIPLIDTESNTLLSSTLDKLRELASEMRSSGIAAKVVFLQTLAQNIDSLAEDEARDPAIEALHILDNLRPKFLFFDDEARDLESDYDPIAIGTDPPKALDNLLKLAQLNISKLQTAIKSADQGQIIDLLSDANRRLREVFADAWSQSNIYPYLHLNDNRLHIIVKEEGSSSVTIAERSDGFKQYIALLSFVALNNSKRKPILLIDEAETHLHYDAQADLVQMLTRQSEVDQIIYTTHSIGCLPEDLGIGVRMIAEDEHNRNASKIQNWFWACDKSGFSPLLFGMGAKTMAFIPVRNALVAEGITDMILLPSMFREAAAQDSLGFQIVPGLSEISERHFAILENGAPKTVYLHDCDKGGFELRNQLLAAGIEAKRIFSIPDKARVGLVLEDLIDDDVYLEAFNEQLQRYNSGDTPLTMTDLPMVNRPALLETWCKANGMVSPSKRVVAYAVLERKMEKAIVKKEYKKALANLCARIQKALNKSRT